MELNKSSDQDKQNRLKAIFEEIKREQIPLWMVLMALHSQLDEKMNAFNKKKIKTMGEIQNIKELVYVRYLIGEAAVHISE
jgi:hypothetical protein